MKTESPDISCIADLGSFIADDDGHEEDEVSSADEASTSVSPAASPAASQQTSDHEENLDSFRLASDDDLPSAASPHDPPFQAGSSMAHRMTTRSSRRALSNVNDPSIQKPSRRSAAAKRSASKSAAPAVHHAGAPSLEQSLPQGQPSQRDLQPQHIFEDLGLVACSMCGNISHRKQSCSCPASGIVKIAGPADAWTSNANQRDAALDDSLPFAELAKLQGRLSTADAPHHTDGQLSSVQKQPQQLPPDAVRKDAGHPQSAPRISSSDDDDDFQSLSKRRSINRSVRRGSAVIEEPDEAPATGTRPGLPRTDLISDGTNLETGSMQAPLPSGQKEPDSAGLARQPSSSSEEAVPAQGRQARKAGALAQSFIQDASLDNDVEFADSIAPAPSSRKRKRLQQSCDAGRASDDSMPSSQQEAAPEAHGRGINHGSRTQHERDGHDAAAAAETDPGSQSLGTPRGQRIQAGRVSKRRSAGGIQVHERIKQHQQATLLGDEPVFWPLGQSDTELSSGSSDDAEGNGSLAAEGDDDFEQDHAAEAASQRRKSTRRRLQASQHNEESRDGLDDGDLDDFIDDSEIIPKGRSTRRTRSRQQQRKVSPTVESSGEESDGDLNGFIDDADDAAASDAEEAEQPEHTPGTGQRTRKRYAAVA